MPFQIGDEVQAEVYGVRGPIISIRTVGNYTVYRVRATEPKGMLIDLIESEMQLAQDRSHLTDCALMRGEAVCSCGVGGKSMNGYSVTLIPRSWKIGRRDIRRKTLWAFGPLRFGLHRGLGREYESKA